MKSIKVLAIDDLSDNLTTLRAVMADQMPEARVISATDGPHGIALAVSDDPDVILLDIAMPGMDGFEVCSKLKTDHRTSSIPVLFFTAQRKDRDSRVKAINLGAEGFIVKPFDEVELIAQVKAMAKVKRANMSQKQEREKLEKLVEERTADLIRQLTERLQIENALEKAAANWNKTFHAIRDGIAILDENQQIVQCNRAFEEFTGLEEDDLKGRHCHDYVHQEGHPVEGCPFLKMFRSLRRESMEMRINGRVCEIIVDPIIDKQGHLSGAVHIITDITQRKRDVEVQHLLYGIASSSLMKNSLDELVNYLWKELGKVIDNSNFIVALYDSESDLFRKVVFNDEKEEVVAWTASQSLSGLVVRSGEAMLLNRAERDKLVAQYNLSQTGHAAECWLGVPIIVRGEPAGIIVVQSYSNGDAYDESDARLLGMVAHELAVVIERDRMVRDLIEAKERAEQSETRFKALHNASFGGITIHDKGVILDCNLGLSEITGFTVAELIGMDGLLLIAAHEREKVMANITSGYEKPYESVGVRKNGTEYPLRLEARNIPYQGRAVRVVEFRDITEQKSAETALIREKERAEESDRLKTAFLQNMSHEIRTPMNGILGFLDLLREPDITEGEKEKYIDLVNRSGQRLLTTINDIIEISKLEAGEVSLILADFSLEETVQYQCDFFKRQIEDKGLALVVSQGIVGSKALVNSDKHKVEGIMTNLINNALKFTERGSIHVSTTLDNGFICITVADTGKGIPPDRLDAIFKRFVQADLTMSRAHEGSGLGLAIVKAYVELLGGSISVHSVPGQGSTFRVLLPYHSADHLPQPDNDRVVQPSDESLAILVAEDDDVSFQILSMMLAKTNHRLVRATTGQEALSLFNAQHFDLILMDLKMPGMNGLDAVKKIREVNRQVPIIAQTAYALMGDREKALEAGCTDYMSKPINRKLLFSKIAEYAPGGRGLKKPAV